MCAIYCMTSVHRYEACKCKQSFFFFLFLTRMIKDYMKLIFFFSVCFLLTVSPTQHSLSLFPGEPVQSLPGSSSASRWQCQGCLGHEPPAPEPCVPTASFVNADLAFSSCHKHTHTHTHTFMFDSCRPGISTAHSIHSFSKMYHSIITIFKHLYVHFLFVPHVQKKL